MKILIQNPRDLDMDMKERTPFPDSSFCPTIYGPVQSRRHGRSLGINLGVPYKKVCTWGCLYCQCGMGERRDLDPKERLLGLNDILPLIREAIDHGPGFDSITFAGNSEPTAHPDFLTIVKAVLKLRLDFCGKWIVNCLSNGSELDHKSVLQACSLLDETWVKLDCGQEELFQKLNRPLSRIGSIFQHVDRMKNLEKLSVQTLVWSSPERPKFSNWTKENQEALLKIYGELKPKNIHLTTLARNPAVPHLKPVSKRDLLEFSNRIQQLGLQVEVFE